LLSPPNLVTGVLALSVTLIRAADTFHKSVTSPLVTIIFLVCALWAIPRQRRSVLLSGSAVLVFIFAADVAVALVRGAQDGVYSTMSGSVGRIILYFSVALLAMVAVASARDTDERNRRILAIAPAPVIYAVINLVLSLGGVQAPIPTGATAGERGTAGSQSQLLGFLGIAGGRIQFPLATSINLFSPPASPRWPSCGSARRTC
jgi:hypothetical protein